MPLHTPLLRVEWNLHRNLKTPLDLKVNEVAAPGARVVFFVHFPLYAVTVCEPDTAFQVTLAPTEMFTACGFQRYPDVVFTPLITVAAPAGCAENAATSTIAATIGVIRRIKGLPPSRYARSTVHA